MGIIRKLFRKEVEPSKVNNLKTQLTASFSGMKNDLDNQNKWINFLHQALTDVKNKHGEHKNNTHNHISRVHNNIGNLNKWINHLHTMTKQQGDRLEQLETNVGTALNKHNDHVVELFKLVHSQKEKISSSLRDDIKNELMLEVQSHLVEHKGNVRDIKSNLDQVEGKLDELKNAHIESKKAVNYVKNKQVSNKNTMKQERTPTNVPQEVYVQQSMPMQQHTPDIIYGNVPLTNPEQKLLNILFTESDPVSYSQLSNKTGHSVNTVRVNMNLLKKKGLIEENMLPNGVKLFNLNNKEKIKKMYNVQHI
jgi:hypothetical protein